MLLRLIGTKSNRAAIGARVTVTTSNMRQMDEVRAGGRYNPTNDVRLHFGLGDVPEDASYEITEGKPIRKIASLSPP